MSPQHEQHFRAIENLIFEWARAIDENRVEAIADLLLEDGRYTVKSRFNHDRDLPMAIIDSRSAAPSPCAAHFWTRSAASTPRQRRR